MTAQRSGAREAGDRGIKVTLKHVGPRGHVLQAGSVMDVLPGWIGASAALRSERRVRRVMSCRLTCCTPQLLQQLITHLFSSSINNGSCAYKLFIKGAFPDGEAYPP